jgi:hypothetical protein
MLSRISRVATIAATFIAAVVLSPSAGAVPDDACSLLTQSQLTTLGASVDAGSSLGPNDKKVCTWRTTSSGDAADSIKYVP